MTYTRQETDLWELDGLVLRSENLCGKQKELEMEKQLQGGGAPSLGCMGECGCSCDMVMITGLLTSSVVL